jgi:hypothetical protein
MQTALNVISLAVLGTLGAGIWLTQDSVEAGMDGAMPETAPVSDTATDAGDDMAADEAAPVDAGAEEPDASVGEDAATDPAAEPDSGGYTVEGTLPGYFIANTDVRFGDLVLENIMAEPAYNGFEERVLFTLEDTSEVAGSNEYGDYYEAYVMNVESYSISADGVSIVASNPEVGTLTLEGVYVADGFAAWTSGAESVRELFTATLTLNDIVVNDASFGFWIGD